MTMADTRAAMKANRHPQPKPPSNSSNPAKNAMTITMIATVDGAPQTLTFRALENAATGERVGDTSAFAAQADWLKTVKQFDAMIPALEVRGATFTNVSFAFPKKSHDGHKH